MKKLFQVATFTLLFASFSSTVRASHTMDNAKITHVVNSVAIPNDGRAPSATHKFDIHVKGQALSGLTIDTPQGVRINRGVQVTNQAGEKVPATVAVNNRKVSVAFVEPVSSGTTLSISMLGVNTPSPNIWHYQINANKAGMNAEIPLGLVRIQTYP